jgi:hypothetical protein
MHLSFDQIRIGKVYFLQNFGESFEFKVLQKTGASDYLIKDIHTMETQHFHELTKYGLGKDFEFYEL